MTDESVQEYAARKKLVEILEAATGGYVIDLSTKEGVIRYAKSIIPPASRDYITDAEIIDGVLHVAISPPLEYIVVHITTPNQES